jgi:hypothetical protein
LRQGGEADSAAVTQRLVGGVPTAQVGVLSMVNQSESAFLHQYLKVQEQALSEESTRNFIKVGSAYNKSKTAKGEVKKNFSAFAGVHKQAYQGGIVVIHAHYSFNVKTQTELFAGGLSARELALLLTIAGDFAPRRIVIMACAAEHYAHDLLVALRDAKVDVDRMEVVYVGGSMKFQPWPNPKFKSNAPPELLYSGPEVEKEEEFGELQRPIADIFTIRTGSELLAAEPPIPSPDDLQDEQTANMAERRRQAAAQQPVSSLAERIRNPTQLAWFQTEKKAEEDKPPNGSSPTTTSAGTSRSSSGLSRRRSPRPTI